MTNLNWAINHGILFMGGGPSSAEMNAMNEAAARRAEEAAARAREQDLADRELFRAQAEEDRKKAEARARVLQARTAKEEKSRIKSLAQAESDAADVADEVATTPDVDQNFTNLFHNLLTGILGGQGMGTTNTGGTAGMKPVKLPGAKKRK
tara:strand:+ start:354 stop:806 length:453 start_codon:yes stop_codon:yes gene_type:complete